MYSRATEGNAIIGTLLAICVIIVGLRLYVRLVLSKSFGIDDALLVVALVFFITYCSCAFAAVVHGVGSDLRDIDKKDVPLAFYFWWLATLFYTVTTVFVRASISIFLNKLCVKKTHKIVIWSTMGVVITYSVFYFILAIFQCTPPSFFWERLRGKKDGSCINAEIFPAATYAHSTISAIADWILGLLPLWLIWGLQMNTRTKVSVGILLGLGMIAGVAAIVRIPYIRILGKTDEFLYTVVDVSIWSLIEAALGIIAAAASALRPLFKRFYQLSGYGTNGGRRSHTVQYPQRGDYMRNESKATRNGNISRGGDKLNVGRGFGIESNAFAGVELQDRDILGDGSRTGSEENLTGKGDIHVHTTVEVNTAR